MREDRDWDASIQNATNLHKLLVSGQMNEILSYMSRIRKYNIIGLLENKDTDNVLENMERIRIELREIREYHSKMICNLQYWLEFVSQRMETPTTPEVFLE